MVRKLKYFYFLGGSYVNHPHTRCPRRYRPLFSGNDRWQSSIHFGPDSRRSRDGAPAGNTIDTQAEQSCKNVAAILAAAGSDMTKVVKTTCFLADMADFAKFNEIYAKYFVSCPARSCVAAKALPKGVLCEIEAIAEV